MRDEERIACELEERLRAALTCDIRRAGAGVHWRLEIGSGPRTCRIDCFWYGPAAAVMLGMNAANARVTHRPAVTARSGAEYLVAFYDADRRIAGGRAHGEPEVVASVAAWCAGDLIEQLAHAWPYVDARRRRMREVMRPIEAACGDAARCVIEQQSRYELWIYARSGSRSCRVHPNEDGQVGASFLLGPAQVASGDVTADPGAVVARWMCGATLAELAEAGATIEPGAEMLERGDAAAWHWEQFRARITDPDDVLAPLRPLLERLAASPVATQFFTYSSLDRLCFSASSHYPWVDDDLPIVARSTNGSIYVGRTRCTVDSAVELLEATLAAYPVRPFLGSAVMLAIPPLDAELAAQGSALRAELVQRSQWFGVEVAHGDRRCEVRETRIVFRDASDHHVAATFADRPACVRAILRWLEARCEAGELGTLVRDRREPD